MPNQPTNLPEPRTAQASERPCEMYVHRTAPIPTRTQGHHRHPVYLQNRVYGRIRDTDLLWLCGTCHDSIHDWISFLLVEARKPMIIPGPRVRREAESVVAWFHAAGAAA